LLDALVDWAMIFVDGEGAIGFGTLALGDFEVVAQIYGGDAERFVLGFDSSFHVGFQII
jgi:hypothetical protein